MPDGEHDLGNRRSRTALMFIDGLGSGGAQKQFVRLATGLARRGHRVTVAVYNDLDHFAPELETASIPIVHLEKPSRWSPRPIIELKRLYRQVGAEAVLTFLRSPAAKAELARFLDPNIRVIVAERSVYDDGPLPLPLRLTQGMHRLAAFVTVNSRYQHRRMEEELPALARRVVTIYNAVALPPQPVPVRETIAEAPRLLAISSLMGYKNSVMLAHAVALLRDEYGIAAQVSWLGETFEHLGDYGAYRDTCAAIAALGLDDQWTWMGVREDVDTVIADHDVLVHPSGLEGMSNAVTEAMAMGLPVIAGRIADHPYVIEEAGAGLLFPDFDARSIAETIAAYCAMDRSTRDAMGAAGRRTIAEQFAESDFVDRYESVLEATIDGTALRLDRAADLGRSGVCAA